MEDPCPICLSPLGEGEGIQLLPRCKHSFHSKCIEEWRKRKDECPVCRKNITNDKVNHRPRCFLKECLRIFFPRRSKVSMSTF
jgi:hypothetical protein